MVMNREAYSEAYQRALGARYRPVWQIFMTPFEDQYTRESRERGARDGAAARAALGLDGQRMSAPSA